MEFFSPLFHPSTWVSLAILTFLEIVLGIDNIIVISILAGKLPEPGQRKARRVGLSLALISRILLLLSINWLMSLQQPWITLFGRSMNGRDIILAVGGLFLIAKSTREIHEKVEGIQHGEPLPQGQRFFSVVVQIVLLDIVFSLDSVITVVGMAQQLIVMIGAIILSVLVMLAASGLISTVVNRYPTFRILALSFLFLIGVVLVADGLGQHIDRGYVYFAMAFSTVVEMLNLRSGSGRGT
ncbi:MAG TPA: TerC family protein [Chthoniobacterales bacterium]|nr:TerC family protein [Chthoniobacterales bacterium]